MSETNIKISLELVDKAAQKALSDFINKSNKADQSLDNVKEKGKGAFNEIAVHIGKATGVYDIFVGNLAANLTTKAFDTMVAGANALFQTFIVDGVAAAMEGEKSLNDLNVALAQTGIYSSKTSEEFEDFASRLQEATGVEDDAIFANAALLQSLGQLDKDGLQRATKAAIDLSAALGKDLASTSEALGKAAAGNTTAIQKMGISFTKGTTDAQTFQNILKALEERFGGSAASKVNTYAGAVRFAKVAFGDLQEEVGNLIIKNPVVLAMLQSATTTFKTMSDAIKQSNGPLEILGQGLVYTVQVSKYLVAAFDVVASAVKVAFNAISTTISGTLLAIVGPFALFSEKAKAIFEDLRDQTIQDVQDMGAGFTDGVFRGGIAALEEMGQAAEAGLAKLRSGAVASVEPVNNTTRAVKDLNEETNKWVTDLAKGGESAKASYDNQLAMLVAFYENKEILESEAEAVNYENKILREQEFNLAKQQLLEERYAAEQNRIINSTVSEETKTQALLAIQARYNTENQKLENERIKKVDELKKKERKIEDENNQYKLHATANMFSALADLAALGGREAFEIAKAFNIASAITNAYAAITKTLADGGPYPFNLVNAAAIGVSAFANVARISQQQAPSFATGGIVPGSSFSGDKVAANVNSGEMILNRAQQKELFNVANGAGGGGALEAKLDSLIGLLAAKDNRVIVNIGGRTIVDSLRSELNAGRSFA